MPVSKIIIISGGSFQGKSLIALDLAVRLKFSGVVSTDVVRNILKVQNPSLAHLSTSTYLLSPEQLLRQMEEVSKILIGVIDIFQSRGEHVVIEGMHLSESFMRWVSTNGFLGICLDNCLPLDRRVVLKGITRSRLRMNSGLNSHSDMFGVIDERNVHNSTYLKHRERIEAIHNLIVQNSAIYGFEVIRFEDIDDAKERAFAIAQRWISGKI